MKVFNLLNDLGNDLDIIFILDHILTIVSNLIVQYGIINNALRIASKILEIVHLPQLLLKFETDCH